MRVLGPVEVQTDAGTLRLVGQRARLLAALVVADRSVGYARLTDWLWDEPPPTARQQVHKLVAALRQIDHGLIRSDRPGYRLDDDRVRCDTTEFRRLAALGDTVSLTAALSLWRGAALTDIGGEPAAAAAAVWEARRMEVVERLARRRIEEGHAATVIAELTEALAAYPTRETLHALLMTALHRTGRTAEALAHYAGVRRLLTDEFGADPGPDLSGLHERLLRGQEQRTPDADARSHLATDLDREHDAGHGAWHDAGRTGTPMLRTVPFDVPDFTGRASELARLVAAADRAGVMAIDGMPGVGKTALAIRLSHLLADRYPGGQLFIDLASHSPAETTLDTAAAARLLLGMLGVPDSRQPTDPRALIALWRSRAAAGRLLIVVDNAPDAATVAPLFPGELSCLVVVTSRARLADLDGATFHSLGVLPADEAAALFHRVLTAGGPSAPVLLGDSDADAAAAVVGWCAGLPLAIRLVAGRLGGRPEWSMANLAAGLRDEEGRRSLLHGPRSRVHLAFAGAVDQLDAEVRRMLLLLARSPMGEFDLPATAALVDRPRAATLEGLEQLADAHLIEPRNGGGYGIHDLVREYAADIADPDPAADRRLLDYYLAAVTVAADQLNDRLRRFDPLLRRPPTLLPPLADRETALAWLQREHGTLVRLACTADDWQLAILLRVYFEVAGHYGDWRATHEHARAVAAGDRSAQGYIALSLGALATWQNDQSNAIREYSAGAELLSDRPALVAGAWATIAMVLHQNHDDAAAITHARRALGMKDVGGGVRALAWCNLGLATARAGAPDEAITLHRRAITEADDCGELSVRCAAHLGLGESSLRLGRPATESFRTALTLAELQSNRIQQAIALDGLAHATHDSAYWHPALAIYRSLGVPQADLVRRHLDDPDRPQCDLCTVS